MYKVVVEIKIRVALKFPTVLLYGCGDDIARHQVCERVENVVNRIEPAYL